MLSSLALCSIVVSTIGVQKHRHSLADQNTTFFGVIFGACEQFAAMKDFAAVTCA